MRMLFLYAYSDAYCQFDSLLVMLIPCSFAKSTACFSVLSPAPFARKFQKKNKNTAKNIILAVAVTFFWQFTARQ
jgi:hypothetical protein